jgi:hypothetical protein
MNDTKLSFLVKKDSQLQEDASAGLMSDERLEERWCRYSIQQDTTPTLIGFTQVPLGMDVDDAFPPFHTANFDEGAKAALAETIRDGGLLIAESNFEPRSLLTYRLDDPNYWFGREATLKYLGVISFRHAC